MSVAFGPFLLGGVLMAAPPSKPPARPPEKRPPVEAAPKAPAAFDLDAFLKLLGEKSAVYETIALRFVCVETNHSSESPLDEKKYDYMYVEEEAQRYRPFRQRHTSKPSQNASEVEMETSFPDSYSWTLMFEPERQHLFHFTDEGEEWYSLRRARVVGFTAPLPFTSGKTIYEWTGKVWIDAENYNFLKVEAEPASQADRLKQELRDYRTSTRFLTFAMGHRPAGSHYEITFLNDYQKLSLPDQAEYRRFLLDLEGNSELSFLVSQRYSQYQFFGVEVNDRFLK